MEYYFLKTLYRFFDLLIDSSDPKVLALSVVFGLWLGFTPALTLHWVLALFIVILLRINLGIVLISALTFLGISLFTTPLMHQLGLNLLTQHPRFIPVWTLLYQAPLFPLTRFNHPHVMGSLVVSLTLSAPLFLLSYLFFAKFSSTFFESWRSTYGYRVFLRYRRYVK